MPAPLAMPSRVTSFEAPDARDSAPARTRNRAEAIFGRVSVVIMACAKSRAPRTLADRASISSGNFARILSSGSGTPMMPVEEGKISAAGTPRIFAASRQTRSQAEMPARPVAQLALPEFTTSARIRPPVAASDARPTSTGAATTRFVRKERRCRRAARSLRQR